MGSKEKKANADYIETEWNGGCQDWGEGNGERLVTGRNLSVIHE